MDNEEDEDESMDNEALEDETVCGQLCGWHRGDGCRQE